MLDNESSNDQGTVESLQICVFVHDYILVMMQ